MKKYIKMLNTNDIYEVIEESENRYLINDGMYLSWWDKDFFTEVKND